MSLPYFPMFPTDFEADTSHLTLAEDGAYNRLLRLTWMSPGCSLPDDDAWILRRMRCTDEGDKAIVLGIISEFFTRENGRVSNARLTREFDKSSGAHEKRVSAGSKGGKAKSLKSFAAASSNAVANPKQPEPEPEPYKRDTNVSPSKPPFGFDEWWNEAPRKKGKGAAIKAYASALKKASPEILLSQIKAYAESRRGEDEQYTAHPATWLNQERWLDEPTIPSKPNGGPNGRNDYASKRRAADESRIDTISEIGRRFDGSRGRGGNQDPSGWGMDGGADRDIATPFLKLAIG